MTANTAAELNDHCLGLSAFRLKGSLILIGLIVKILGEWGAAATNDLHWHGLTKTPGGCSSSNRRRHFC
jgi:hypothetical protein